MASRIAVASLLLFAVANACLLPPEGCTPQVCNSFKGFIVPASNGNFSDVASWAGWNNKLAFIRSSFNKNIRNLGPNSFTPATWLAMRDHGLYAIKSGPPVLPSLNFEFYTLAGATYTLKSTTGSLPACCNACRLDSKCPEYFYVPKSAPGKADTTGSCYFITKAPITKDGPFDWVNPSDPKSPRTLNIGSPTALDKTQTAAQLKSSSAYPGFVAGFLGGYCNNHEFTPGEVTDDPHFTGAHGTRFDFNGELNKAFCLLTDTKLHLNALLKGYKNDNTVGATVGSDGKAIRSWIKEVGLVWADSQGASHSLHLVARSGKDTARGAGFLASASLDGQQLEIPEAGQAVKAGDLSFVFLGTSKKGWYDMDQFQVVVDGQLDMTFYLRVAHPLLRSPEDAEVHFNLMLNDVKTTEKVHGVLGQTYRNTPAQVLKAVKYSELSHLLGGPIRADGKSGAGFLEGSVADYESSDVLKPDCKMSAFSV